jgi:hypothetical protein
MATFTMTLSELFTLKGAETVQEQSKLIGLNDYPIWQESYRDTLNQKIIDRYWNQEIGQETVSLFKHHVGRTMREIMPLYNLYYESAEMDLGNPLHNVDVRNWSKSKAKSDSSSSSETESNTQSESRAVSSETPQVMLSGNGDYATAAQDNVAGTKAGSTATDGSTSAQEGEGESGTEGFQGSKALALLEYRQTFLNIDVQVIEDLATCFMLVWSNGDEL